MKKHKLLLATIITFLVFLLLNIGYFLATNWRNFLPKKAATVDAQPELKIYDNNKLGYELKYPPTWNLTENENMVEINPRGAGSKVYFSVSLRTEFTALSEVKLKISPTVPIVPVDIGNASGFKYKDTDDHDSIWLLHSGKIYLVRVYYPSQDAEKIFLTLTFKD